MPEIAGGLCHAYIRRKQASHQRFARVLGGSHMLKPPRIFGAARVLGALHLVKRCIHAVHHSITAASAEVLRLVKGRNFAPLHGVHRIAEILGEHTAGEEFVLGVHMFLKLHNIARG